MADSHATNTRTPWMHMPEPETEPTDNPSIKVFPAWDYETPLDIYKWKRDLYYRVERARRASLLRATDDDGKPLYRMTVGGCLTRTKPVSSRVRKAVLARDGACLWCGSVNNLEVDHIVRYIDGGSNEPDNLRVLCQPCHASRGGRP